MTTLKDTSRDKSATDERLSPDGKWRSFPKVSNLLQYVSTRVYFARVKIDGKLIRRSLGTDVFTTAKLKLGDFVKKQHEPKAKVGTIGAGLKTFLRALRNSHDVSDQTKRFKRYCALALLKS